MNPVKVGFVLLSNSRQALPSTRCAVLNMFPFLRAENFDPHIVFEPAQAETTPDVSGLASRLCRDGFRIVVFQKVRGPGVEALVRRLSAAGIKTVYCVCDLVDAAMAEASDATIVVTDYLKSLYPIALHARIHVVHDGIEHADCHKTEWGGHRGSSGRPLRAVLVTSVQSDRLPLIVAPPNWLHVTIVGRYPPSARIFQRVREARWMLASQQDTRQRLAYLRFLSNRRIDCIAWDAIDVYKRMKEADIGIIPIDALPLDLPGLPAPNWKVKSENRLSMKMCMGLPVIATPIPAYEPVVMQGQNGFLARTRQDWINCFEALRDPALRESMGRQARESVRNRYSLQEQARLLIGILNGLLGKNFTT